MPADEDQARSLQSAFEILAVNNCDEARKAAESLDEALVLFPAQMGLSSDADGGLAVMAGVLEHLGEGAGVISADGRTIWANRRLTLCDSQTRDEFVRTCLRALERFNQAEESTVPIHERPALKCTFTVGDTHYETIVSIARVEEDDKCVVSAVIGVLWEVTANRRLQSKLEAVDAAGAELLRIEASSIAQLNMAERLKLLEEKIVWSVRELLNFDDFEIRLIDRETNRLELVITEGIAPLKIGEVFHAEGENSGISGLVAATGRSYLCNDVTKDPHYREGLVDAASELTVPLRLHDQVIGVFNIESNRPNAFSDDDRRFAEIFGRYIAMSMHILDLLVVERYTTNEQVAENVLTELNKPIGDIASQAAALRTGVTDPELREGLDHIIESAGGIRRRLQACITGPKTILGAEQETHRSQPDPIMIGKRVLVADNEPTVRDAIESLLVQKGCQVTTCSGGVDTIEQLRQAHADRRPFDLVISDIHMGDRNGYEVFRTTKEVCADTPVILMTGFGYDPHHSIVRASQEGLHSFLFKPLRASQLLETIASAFVPETNG